MGKIFKTVGAQTKRWTSKDELQTIIDELRISIEQTESDEEETAVGDKDT